MFVFSSEPPLIELGAIPPGGEEEREFEEEFIDIVFSSEPLLPGFSCR
jgi:hypothetical protein